MKRHLKKAVLAMIAFVLCGVMNVTGSNVSLAATDVETEQTAELEAASTVKHVSARKLYHAGDYLYIETSKGVLAYNMKKQTAKYVVERAGVSGVLVHKGYLYCEGDTICPAFFEENPLPISGNFDAFFW